ncbi:hypothetical protein HMPREF9452_01951 [Collinsella tanakaei YIT 12063]|uniref:Uncharacterized protein n=1 Tax=Collinsella tanakaei YIT 12063 TaxID=742742 RepID=G1WKQ0_9ACTN|nr:hypothetical protein HMPREF9452_01951 [Collinsella tanakaei YIT 12063]
MGAFSSRLGEFSGKVGRQPSCYDARQPVGKYQEEP